ncbi:unnamed protein product, partial [Allacma fusca]
DFFLLCGEDHDSDTCEQISKNKIGVKPQPSRGWPFPKSSDSKHKQYNRVRMVTSKKIGKCTGLVKLNAVRRFHYVFLETGKSLYINFHDESSANWLSLIQYSPTDGTQTLIFFKTEGKFDEACFIPRNDQKFSNMSTFEPSVQPLVQSVDDLADGEPLWRVQKKVQSVLNNCFIIGSNLESDFEGEFKYNMILGECECFDLQWW